MRFRVGDIGEDTEYEYAGTSYLGRSVTVDQGGNGPEVRANLVTALSAISDIEVCPYLPVGGLPDTPAVVLKANPFPAQIAMGPGGCTTPSFDVVCIVDVAHVDRRWDLDEFVNVVVDTLRTADV